MKGQNEGVKNEEDFAKSLDNKNIQSLHQNAKKLIEQLYPNINEEDTILAVKVGGKGLKPDVEVSVHNNKTNISIKKGGGNSVHQEKISLFLLFCKDHLNMTDETRDSFLSYLYGDGTLDGKGAVEDRLDGNKLREEYQDDIKKIQSFILANSRPLIERFLVYGRLGKDLNIKADYLYHGQISEGVWCPLDEAVDFLVKKAKKSSFSYAPAIGPLTLQTWNRNLGGNPDSEDRRNSIQVKWGGKIHEYITKINKIYLDKIKKHPKLAIPRIFGDNSHGFSNAKEIADGLDGCRVKNLRGSLLGLINTMFNGVALTDTINCKIIKKGKPDLQIGIGSKSINVSIFIGSGNSVHQENFLDFILFCRNSLDMNTQEENALRFIYYGDGTLDGTGNVEDRLKDSRTIKLLYPEQAAIAQAFFDKHRKELAKRFLVTGKYTNQPESDCVFHGNVQEGIAMSYNDVLDYIESYNGIRTGLLSIGPLSFQMWNRNLSGEDDKEYKRESLQIKWPSMPERIKEAYSLSKVKLERSKINGINAEYELVSFLNKNREQDNPLWKELRSSLDLPSENVYAIRVSNQVDSKFLNQKIYPKSDLYLCKANIPQELLESIGFALDEEIAKEYNIKYEPIKGSGISCKIPSSQKFTYAKISVSNFEKIFGNTILGAGASIFVKGDDISLNTNVINAWKVNEFEFLKYVKNTVGIDVGSLNSLTDKDWAKIKKVSNFFIEDIIRNNQSVSEMIFTGKGLFEDPYYAPFLFSNGKMKLNNMPNYFSITTGSGRHNGKFTIIIKPASKSMVEHDKFVDFPKVAEESEPYK